MTELYEALEREQQYAEKELDWLAVKAQTSYSLENDKERSYWQGYYDAMTNAAALIYGPTPLDETERN